MSVLKPGVNSGAPEEWEVNLVRNPVISHK